jgi:signal transduction histidine kinase
MAELISKIEESQDTYDKLKAESEARQLYSEEESNLYADFEEKWDEYLTLSFEFFDLVQDNQQEAAIALINDQGKPLYDAMSSDLVKLVESSTNDAFQAAQRSERTFNSARRVTLILMIATIILSIVIVTVLIRYITVPVTQLEEAARTVASGDLNVSLHVESRDEIGNLANSFNQMTVSLKNATEKMQKQAGILQAQNHHLEQTMQELKDTQEQLLMKEKMASLGDLVAGITHEINNPMGAVASSTDISKRCLQRIETAIEQSKSLEDLTDNAELSKILRILRENLNVTDVAGKRVTTIVQSLKNFARLDESEYQRVNIHDGLDSSLTLLGTDFGNRISLTKQYGDIPKIDCFPSELNQVFINLLKNASQAIDKEGTISIKTVKDNGRVHISISDSGRGIPPEKINRIFDFGFSAGGDRVKLSSGLSIAYNIIQKHQGEIKVQSEPGKGTCFTVILPVTA